ncbi:MAG: S8 family serine peptidase [Bacteroidota bacterium]
MGKYLLLLSFLFFGFSFSLQAQEAPYMQGEILVQIGKDQSIRHIEKAWRAELGQSVPLFRAELISDHNRIWLLEFDPENIEHDRFLSMATQRPGIEIAQNNHQVFLRDTLPNDPQIPQQWQYVNTGQDGGTVGADIDAELAWEIATGGLTPLGDTIVVAVVDDGFDWDHVDFEGNVWYNYDEIPNNNIDDDNNGYIDDYRGWSTIANSGNFNGGGHGTPVAGIVGARGNNGIGVAGVNWNVKLMIIQGGTGVESEVIQAYSYALEHRMRYNETDGADGAFVVATNSSWGVDFGQPSNAPLWCAFYDTLGTHGILSAAATINGNQNVDVVGDLPTACPSDYLISVTNMNRFDQKVTGAGYGAVTIDLGAFGAETWTTNGNNGYSGFGGTSGATPYVTGTIALIYSTQCPGFTQLAKVAPDQAALQAKQYIYSGVDPNTSLDGITTTGGRLNLHHTMQEAVSNCPTAAACFSPFGYNINGIGLDSADISWVVLETNLMTRLRIRETGTSDWFVDSTTTDNYTFFNLGPCTEYEVEFQSQCDTTASGFVTGVVFRTDGCCENPLLNDPNVTDESINLSWSSITAAESYDVRYKLEGEAIWTEVPELPANQLLLDQLLPCTYYEVQVRTNCADETLDWSDIQLILTGCGACTANTYCASTGSDTDFEYIENIAIGNVDLSSGASGGFESFFTDPIQLEIDSTYALTITPNFPGGADLENYRIWIDFNQDGSFHPLFERVFFTPTATDATEITGEISIPATALPGITRMRATIRWSNDGQPSPCGDFEYGEVEDHCVEIVQPLTNTVEATRNQNFSVAVQQNPFVDQLNLTINTARAGALDLAVYHASGQLVYSRNLEDLGTGQTTYQLNDLANLPVGIYLLEVSHNDQRQTIKLVKSE